MITPASFLRSLFKGDALSRARKEFELGRLERAEKLCQELTENPQYQTGESLHLLGLIYTRMKHPAAAIENLSMAVHVDPANGLFQRDLGHAYKAANDCQRAAACFHEAIKLGSADAAVHNALGQVFVSMKQLHEAEAQFRLALSLEPGWPEAQSNLGKILLDLDRADEAEQLLRSALEAAPDDSITHNRWGALLRGKGKYADAEASFRNAIRLRPDYADAYNNLGAVLNEQRDIVGAEGSFRSAVTKDPGFAVAWCNLGLVLSDRGMQKQAEACFVKAIEVEPSYFYARLTLVMNKLKEVYESEEEITRSRAAYRQALEDLLPWMPVDEKQIVVAAETVGWITPFYLAYQGMNDRDLQLTYGKFVCELMAKRYPHLASLPPAPVIEEIKPLRIGIVSGFFYDHSVWKTLIRGWIENIDRSRFEIYGYYTRLNQDADTAVARRLCGSFIEGLPFERLANKIREDALHVLIFPEIGMDPVTTKLATLRLAPAQCNSWGHPITSGMPTIDYYLSSELMEPRVADQLYTEKLIKLPNLSVHYTPPL